MKRLTYWKFLPLFSLAFALAEPRLHAEQFTLQLDETVSEGVPGPGAGVITDNTETDVYTFTGSAGQNVFFEELSVAAAFKGWLTWEVKSPSGQTVLRSYIEGNHEGRKTLPESGEYTLRVSVGSKNPEYVGTYSFRLRSIPPDPTFPIRPGDVISDGKPAAGAGRIEVPGARDNYTFEANAGDQVFIEELGAAKDFKGWLYWDLRSAAGQSIASSYFDSGNEGRKLLAESGTYTIQVYARANEPSYTGDYSFQLRTVPPDQTFAIKIGDTVSDGVPGAGAGRIETALAQDQYTFTGTAGENVFFEQISADAAFAGWLQWQVRTPSGQLLVSAYFGSTVVGSKILPETGTYTMRVAPGANNPAYVGAYSFRIRSAGGDSIALQIGDVVSDGVPAPGAGRIELPGGQDNYTLNGTAGQSVVFEQIHAGESLGGWLKWEIKAPSGTQLLSDFFKDGRLERRVLPETGTYSIRVLVGASDPSLIGEYSFRTYSDVLANPDSFATPPGQALTMPDAKFLCNDRYEAGEQVQILLPGNETAEGGQVARVNGGVLYTPKSGFSGIDHFEYELRGQYGGSSRASVRVQVFEGVDQQPMVVSTFLNGSASVRVCLLGAPGETYEVQESGELGHWTTIGTLTADDAGSMLYDYSVQGGTMQFYRFYRGGKGE